MQHVVLRDWLLSLHIMFARFIYIAASVSTSSLFMAKSYFIVWIEQLLFLLIYLLGKRVSLYFENSEKRAHLIIFEVFPPL